MKQRNNLIKKLYPYRANIRVGFKLAAFSAFILLGNYVAAGIALLLPLAGFNPGILATGDGDGNEGAEEVLLAKITKQVEKVMKLAEKEFVKESAMNKEIEKLNKDVAKLSAEGMAALDKQLKQMQADNETLKADLKKAQDAMVVQSAELKKLTDNATAAGKEAKKTSFRDALKEAFMDIKDKVLVEKKDQDGERLSLMKFFDENGSKATTPKMTIKAPVDMFIGNIAQPEVPQLRLTELDPQRVGIPLNIYPHVLTYFMVKSISRPYMALLVVYSYEDGAATKAEGAASTKSSFLFQTVKFPAVYVATHFVLSDETLDDLNEVLDEIAATAPDKINEKIDTYVLGTAGDDITTIKGIRTAAKSTAYATVFGPASVDGAYEVDVVCDMKQQCENNNYIPNVLLINPADVALLAAKKNTFEDSKSDKRVVYGPTGEPTYIDGLRIIKARQIPKNQFVVLDNSQPWIGRRQDMTMELGYNGTDLTEGQKTLVIKIRIAFGVRDKAAVIWCSDVTTAVTAITK